MKESTLITISDFPNKAVDSFCIHPDKALAILQS
jgi:hypothetical protein